MKPLIKIYHNLSFNNRNKGNSLHLNQFFTVFVICLLLISVFFSTLIVMSTQVIGMDDPKSSRSSTIPGRLFAPTATPSLGGRVADSDNSTDNATELIGLGPTIVNGNLSGLAATGDDFVDYYKIFIDNHAPAGANADKLSLDFNCTAPFNITMVLYDPWMHWLARGTTGSGFNNSSVNVVAQSTGYHYIEISLDPQLGYADYQFTYALTPVINNKLDNDNDFSNATGITLTVTNMGTWEKKEYSTSDQLNQTYDIHDFYNITINASENISITINLPLDNTYGIELFNGSNSSYLLASGQFSGNDTNRTLDCDINYTGNYSFRIFSIIDDPVLYGGTGAYNIYILIKPQDTHPTVRIDAPSTINMQEDDPPKFILLNDTIFFDPDIGNTSDQLSFFILNGTTWDPSYLSSNLSVQIAPDGNASIQPLPDINTTGEQLIFRVEDWLGFNITHTITVIVTPVNDGPYLVSVNNILVNSHYLDLLNDHNGYNGAWEDQPFNLTVVANDNEGNEIDFDYVSNRIFYHSKGYNNTFIHNFTFYPDNTLVGVVQINVSINESFDYDVPGDWVVINISVNNTNDDPYIIKVNDGFYNTGNTVEFLGDNGVFVGQTINFTITAVDVDLPHGDILTFNTTNTTLLDRGVLTIVKAAGGAVATERIANISYSPEALDEGIRLINITVKDTASGVSYIILKVEVKDASMLYTLTETNVTFNYDERGAEDDYTFYELVYTRPETQITYNMMGYTAMGNVPGVDIVEVKSSKVDDYINVSVTILDKIPDDTVIRLYFVQPSAHQEPILNVNASTLPGPYTPNPSTYYLSISHNDPDSPPPLPKGVNQPYFSGPNIIKFGVHLGTLENDYGIGYGVPFGLFVQAYLTVKDASDFDYFAYDSVGVGAAKAPNETVSYLLRATDCLFDEIDPADDVYGYSMHFTSPDRSSGVTLKGTDRGGRPEIDLLRMKGERNGVYFDVTVILGNSVSNNSKVRYILYIVKPEHTESGIHLTPNQLTPDNYPEPYSPATDSFYHFSEYNNGTIIMADKLSLTNNRLLFSFHLGRLQHPELGNLSRGVQFGIFAVAILDTDTDSALDYGFYYDTAGFGAQSSPTMIYEPTDDDGDGDEGPDNFLYILGNLAGIPILLLIIILIIVICIIAGYAARVKSKYGAEIDVDVPAVPAIPTSRSAHPPEYGVSPGALRDERYYDNLYKEEYETGYETYGLGAGEMRYGEQYDDEMMPETQVPPVAAPELEPALPEEEVEAPEEEELAEEVPEEELTDEELGLLVSPDELISEEVEEEMKELEEPEGEPVTPEVPEPDLEGAEEEQVEGEAEAEEEEEVGIIELPGGEEEQEIVKLPEAEEEMAAEEELVFEEEPVEEEPPEGEPVEEEEPAEEEFIEETEPVKEEEPVLEEEPLEEEEPLKEPTAIEPREKMRDDLPGKKLDYSESIPTGLLGLYSEEAEEEPEEEKEQVEKPKKKKKKKKKKGKAKKEPKEESEGDEDSGGGEEQTEELEEEFEAEK